MVRIWRCACQSMFMRGLRRWEKSPLVDKKGLREGSPEQKTEKSLVVSYWRKLQTSHPQVSVGRPYFSPHGRYSGLARVMSVKVNVSCGIIWLIICPPIIQQVMRWEWDEVDPFKQSDKILRKPNSGHEELNWVRQFNYSECRAATNPEGDPIASDAYYYLKNEACHSNPSQAQSGTLQRTYTEVEK